jgi:hypothetical protein
LEIKLEFATRLFPDSARAVEKNCHGRSPHSTNNGYGTPPAGIFPNLPKTSVRISIVRKGRIKDHATPTTVCL